MPRCPAWIGRLLLVILAVITLVSCGCPAQSSVPPAVVSDARPLPAVDLLMHRVEANQKAAEATIQNYTYVSAMTVVKLNGQGDARQQETTVREVFYIDGVRLERLIQKNGRALSAEEQQHESNRLDARIAKAREVREKGGGSTSGEASVSFARFLELGSFTHERRVTVRGRDTIALDYTGDPNAKTHNALEGVIHEMAGTVWIDEQTSALSRIEGHFLRSFKVGGGLLFSVAKDTAFTADWTLVNNEVWLPAGFTANGSLRALLLISFSGRAWGSITGYRRFKATTTILPGVRTVDGEAPTSPPPAAEHAVPPS